MALSKCPECGNMIAIDAKACPKCGHRFRVPASSYPKLVIFAVVVLGLLIAWFLA